MIVVHKLNGTQLTINAEPIECLEGGAQTCVVLATGNRFNVTETPEQITDLVIAYRKKVGTEGKVANPIKGYQRENP